MEKQFNSLMYFLCRINNPIGLKLEFYTDGEDRCIAHLRPRPELQGYARYLYGDIVLALLQTQTLLRPRTWQ